MILTIIIICIFGLIIFIRLVQVENKLNKSEENLSKTRKELKECYTLYLQTTKRLTEVHKDLMIAQGEKLLCQSLNKKKKDE
jgi:uncharacterized protein YoxC